MIKNRRIDAICCAVLAVVLVVTCLFMNGEKLGLTASAREIGYESRLFDTSKVHTIDIVVDDWEGFLETCTDEEYITANLVIDGEAVKNVGLRAKGNTSLSSVASYGNDRYSFKIEVDHYDSSKSYHGLDKFCLNNIIQDNTYMKDYLSYTMMAEMGVASPLCSFVYITVNGEDWGLYLAVEAVEDSFLTRNYGSDSGDLYKPDSMSMGGGRGNGKDFDMDEFTAQMEEESSGDSSTDSTQSKSGKTEKTSGDTETQSEQRGGRGNGGMFNLGEDMSAEEILSILEQAGIDVTIPDDVDKTNIQAVMQAILEQVDMASALEVLQESGLLETQEGGFGGGDFGGGFGGMGSTDTKLQYIDDDPDSYSNIFSSAKTNVTEADQKRLIASLKTLSENISPDAEDNDVSEVVNIETVIRYFVVHNFVCNDDSYTGSIVHNYYLYEKDGVMEMIPWDYNLAFGGFGGGFGGSSGSGMTSTVNSPIDSPVSGSDVTDRPMVAWIFANEEYTKLYHEIYQELIDQWFTSGYFEQLIDETVELISPYVEKDPTAFCSYDEFVEGAATLKEFCLLRAESVSGQLDGTIPSTSEGQSADSSALIDGSALDSSTMGSQGMGGGGFGGGENGGNDFGGFGGGFPTFDGTENDTGTDAAATPDSSDFTNDSVNGSETSPALPDGEQGGAQGNPPDAEGTPQVPPESADAGNTADAESGATEKTPAPSDGDLSAAVPMSADADGNTGGEASDTAENPGGNMPGQMPDMPAGGFSGSGGSTSASAEDWILLGVSCGVLLLGLIAAKLFRRW